MSAPLPDRIDAMCAANSWSALTLGAKEWSLLYMKEYREKLHLY